VPRTLPLAFAFAAVAASPAVADSVKLKNGDTLTGTIVSVADGKVALKTDAAGHVTIDLAQVETIATDAPITVDLADGTRIMGRAVAGEAGSFSVEKGDAGTLRIAFAELDAINKPPRAWTGSLTAAFTSSHGNTENVASALDAHAENRGDRDRIIADAWYRATRTEDQSTGDTATTENKLGVAGKYDYFFEGKEYYVYANTRAEKDRLAEIDLRFVLGAGGGYQFLETPSDQLRAEGGLGWFYENYGDGTDTVSDPSGRMAASYAHHWNAAHSFFDDVEAYKIFGAHDDYLVRNKGGFRQKLTDSFFAQEWVEYVWDSTPAAGKERVDVIYYVGVGWTF